MDLGIFRPAQLGAGLFLCVTAMRCSASGYLLAQLADQCVLVIELAIPGFQLVVSPLNSSIWGVGRLADHGPGWR